MAEAQTAFVADAALRLDAPWAQRRPRVRLAVAVLVALVLETGVFGVVWFERYFSPPPPPPLEEIPVEIVVEPPPEPPPPELKAEQEYEKPATDAPRAGKSDHDDETVAEKEKPAAAPPPPAPTPSPEATQPAAETPAPELPKAAEAEAPPPVKPEPPKPAEKPKPSVSEILAKAMEPIPDVEFGGAAIQSPVTGGKAKATYLTMLYGLIMPRLQVPPTAQTYGRRLNGRISFAVDARGRLTYRYVAEASGSMELDAAAMQAVAAASKSFPPPPKGAPVEVTFTYTFN